MNRAFIYRGRPVPGVHQRCSENCGSCRCSRHRWQYTVELPAGADGKRRRLTKGGFLSGREAGDARVEAMRQHRTGGLLTAPAVTVAAWLRSWLATRIERGDLRDGTIADYRDVIERHLVPRLGHLNLAQLRGLDITNAYDAMRRDRTAAITAAEEINVSRRAEAAAANTVKHPGRPRVAHLVPVPRRLGPLTFRRIHNVLSGALASAVRSGLIERNPAPDAELPRIVIPRPRIWTADQLGAFLDGIADHRLYPLFHLAAYTGMRRGEVCGLCWDDVDLARGRITVRWQITDVGYRNARTTDQPGRSGQYRSRPKTRAGDERVVDLDPATIGVLHAWQLAQQREQAGPSRAGLDRHDQHGPYRLAFTRENGEPLDPSHICATFARLVRDTGLPRLKLHGLRHLNISLQIDAGVTETVIAMRVGHSSPALIHSTYGHLIGTVGRRAAEATAALVPRRTPGAT
jgi:integrase